MRRFFYLFTIVLCISSCAEEDPPLLVYDIEDDFSFRMQETLRENGRDFKLEISTLSGYGCENVEIDADFYSTATGKEINIHDLHVPNSCGEGNFHPTETLNFGDLDNGEYSFNISLQNVVFNYGTLTITDNAYHLDFPKKLEGGQFAFQELNRIPDAMVWGRIEYEESDGLFLLEEFKSQLSIIGANEMAFPSGQYSDFQVDSLGNMVWSLPADYSRSLSFAFQHDIKDQQIYTDIIEAFMEQYGETYTIDVDLFTSNGKEF